MPTTKRPETKAWTCVCTGRRCGHAETTIEYAATAREARKAARRKWRGPLGWEATTCTAKRAKACDKSEPHDELAA